MKSDKFVIWFVSVAGLVGFLGSIHGANAQAPAAERRFLTPIPNTTALVPPKALACTGPISKVVDVADENAKTTNAVYLNNPGGGEGGQFDKTPVLTTTVTLVQGMCLDAHLSAIVGGRLTYGVSTTTLFQVALTRTTPPLGPRHMVGHFETPYGHLPKIPAVALEAERDIDMLSANFFKELEPDCTKCLLEHTG